MLMLRFRSPAAHHHSVAYRLLAPIGAYAPEGGKPRFGLLAGGFLLACFLLLPGCRRTPPEQALRDTIAQMQEAGEAGEIDALFEPIAEDFTASEGMDRTNFRRYVTLVRLRQKNVGVTLGPIDVKLFGDRATANFTATITGGPGLLPDQAQIYDIETGWRLDGADWKLISARWKVKL
jgi:hypothetical protein